MSLNQTKRLALLDLFCGCGGFALGAHQAGFDVALSVDIDKKLTYSFAHNFPSGTLELADIATLSAKTVLSKVGVPIDGIIGGPPCQGFSAIGRQDDTDPRRDLLVHFFRLVGEIRPKFFLMENVQGLGYPRNRHVLERGLKLLPDRYKVVGPMVLNCADFGGATSRSRIFVFGYDRNHVLPMTAEMFAGDATPTTVRHAISDLAGLSEAGESSTGYDLWRLGGGDELSDYAQRMRGRTKVTTSHKKTPHRPEIVKRFATVKPGRKDEVGKHFRLSWSGQCPTLRAGTGADKGSYQSVRPIHPSQSRVITVREAARLQGFPDHFRFHPTVWHSFRMIGNSVSPIIAAELLRRIWVQLNKQEVREAAE